jgi:hypothetical protein
MDLTTLDGGALEQLRADLAAKRTEIREAQVAVQAEIDFRAALDAMPDASRRIVQIRLAGGVAPVGGAEIAEED